MLRLGEGGRDQPNNAVPSSQPPQWSLGGAWAGGWQAPGLTAPSNTAERRGPAGMRPRAAGLEQAREGLGQGGKLTPSRLTLPCSSLQAPLAQPDLLRWKG